MRLAFDLDGTLADLQGALAVEASRLFPGIDPAILPASADQGERPAEGSTDAQLPAPALSPRQQQQLWDAVCSRVNFWESLEELEPGVLGRLYQLSTELGWEIIFLTSRPETRGETAQVQSHRWLAAHGFPTPSVFVVHSTRGRIAAALQLDVLVDDRPDNCLDVTMESRTRAILVWRGDGAKVPGSARQLGIGAVASVHECLDILETLDRERTDGVSMLDRLKRLLGLKTQSTRVRDRQATGTA
jgi:hypothetical protein